MVPLPFVQTLDKLKTKEQSQGAEDVLDRLKRLDHTKFQPENAVTEAGKKVAEGVTICEYSTGLDIAFIDRHKSDTTSFSVTDLEDRVRKIWCSEDKKPTVMTLDASHHFKFKGRGMIVEDPGFLTVNTDIVNEGMILGNEHLHAELQQNGHKISIDDAMDILGRELYPEQFIKFQTGQGRFQYAQVVFDRQWNSARTRIVEATNGCVELILPEKGNAKTIRAGQYVRDNILGIKPLDMEQYFAMQRLLLNDDISLAIICGKQGSGKTIMSYAASVDQILWYDKEIREKRGLPERKGGRYNQLVILKPNEILGGKRRDVGALPGDLYMKMKPYLGSYIDAHKLSVLGELIPFEHMLLHPRFPNDYGDSRPEKSSKQKIAGGHLPGNMEAVEMTYSEFMRGRSFKDVILVLDEAQNWTPYEVKTIIERAGEGCKIIVMGDPAQVDNPLCSRGVNGLTGAVAHYLKKPYSSLLALSRNYRHQMSEDTESWKVYAS